MFLLTFHQTRVVKQLYYKYVNLYYYIKLGTCLIFLAFFLWNRKSADYSSTSPHIGTRHIYPYTVMLAVSVLNVRQYITLHWCFIRWTDALFLLCSARPFHCYSMMLLLCHSSHCRDFNLNLIRIIAYIMCLCLFLLQEAHRRGSPYKNVSVYQNQDDI